MKPRIIICFVLVILLTVFLSLTNAVSNNDNPIEVVDGEEITYYLRVRYDGVDREGIESSETVTSTVYSDYIYVEDRIPEGLTDISIVQTEDGTIGAQDGSGNLCAGEVVGGVNGVNVDTENNVVSFKVYGLKAGCSLTVGINATVPTVAAGQRNDYFNVATATEGIQTAISNIVHIWTGKASVPLYSVTYSYVGDVPDGATPLPEMMTYPKNNVVKVMADGVAQGYTFDGWRYNSETGDVVDDTFVMPASNVVLYGKYTPIDTSEMKKVTYEIVGDIKPENYDVPSENSYFSGTSVNVDTLKKGDVFDGYRFLGWTVADSELAVTTDAVGNPKLFTMPDKDVVIQGSWELVTYKVTYKFHLPIEENDPDYNLPWDSYLPTESYYRPGETVALKDISGEPSGYNFLGWYKESQFIMPNEDVVIYGEWEKVYGLFDPVIQKEVLDEKEYYQPGDVVKYKITVTNDEPFDIKNVYVVENKVDAYFIESVDYVLEDNQIALIENLASGASVELFTEYVVTPNDVGVLVNEVEIIAALADNYYTIDSSKEYKATADVDLKSKLKICKNEVEVTNDNVIFQFFINNTDYSFNSWLTLKSGSCQNIYLEPGEYQVAEIVSQDYKLYSIKFNDKLISVGDTITLKKGEVYNLEFYNKFFLKPYYHSYGRVINVIKGGE